MSATDIQFPGLTLRQPPLAPPDFVVPAKYAHLPQKMQAENRFNVWRKNPRAGSNKFDKVPYNPRTNNPANSPELGVSLQEAYSAEVSGGYDGIGFYVEYPYMVSDLDDCVNAETGEIDPGALEIAATLNTFVELSVSRTGLHFWMLGEKPGDACRRGNLEIYNTKRFMAIGSAMEGCPRTIEDRTKELAVVYGRMLAGDSKKVVEPSASTPEAANEPASDSQIHHAGKAITNLLTLLSTGDYTPDSKPFRVTDEHENWVEYSSQSEAIASLLVCLAAKHDCDPEKMEQEYLNSHLSEIPKWANGKWDRLKNDEIKSAIAKIKKTAASSTTAPAIQTENKSADWRTQFVTVGQLQTGGVRMLVEGFLPEGISMLGALSGVGKTWFGLSLAKALTTGKPFLGRFGVKNIVPVLYLIPESNGAAFRQRAEKFHIPDDPNLFLCRTVSQGSTLLMDDPAVKAAVAELRPIVILDTAIRFNKSEDENSSSNNKMLVDDSIGLLAAGARAVLGMHHATKASAQEGLTLQNSLRGTGDLGAMCDAVYGLKRNETLYDDGNGPLQLSVVCLKPRDFDPPEPFTIAATTKDQNGKTVSFIDTTGDFALLDVAELMEDLNGRFKRIVSESPELSLGEVAEALGIKKRRAQTLADKLHYKKVKGRWQERIKINTSEKAIEVAI
jgi:hypothetical protein